MINEIKGKLERHKILVSNFNFMSILQISQIIFPLLIYPYLIRVLGKETYGIIAYSNAIIAYFVILINFGFNISEIKDISISRNKIETVSEIVSSVLIIRTILFIFAIIILTISVISISDLKVHKWLYFAYFGILINGALNPSFYFQGIERMKFITIITVISNFIFLILTILIVKKPSQYILVPLFTSIGSISGCLIGLFIVFIIDRVRFSFRPFNQLLVHFKESVPFFSSRISVLAIDKSNFILIGSFIGYTEVAYYDLAAKFVAVITTPINVFSQVLFPNVSRTQNIALVIKTLRILILIYILGYISLFFLGEPLIKIIGGIDLIPSKYVLYLLGITAISELISTFLGAPLLLAKGHKSEYNKSIIYGSFFYLFVVFILYILNWIGLYQLTLASVSTSAFILFYRLYYSKIFKLI